jgi:hypothetical protein
MWCKVRSTDGGFEPPGPYDSHLPGGNAVAAEDTMEVSPLAGKPADPASLVNVPKLVTAYYTETPDAAVPAQMVSFGTSGHRGSAFDKAFNEWHITKSG